MRSTDYADCLAEAADGDHRIERIRIKDKDAVEIRFSYWPNGNFAVRPLDLSEEDLLVLIGKGIDKGVFSAGFLRDLHTLLYDRRPSVAA